MSATADAVDYRSRAELHRPTDQAAIAQAIRDLHASGLREHDIIHVLQVHEAVVREALASIPPAARAA